MLGPSQSIHLDIDVFPSFLSGTYLRPVSLTCLPDNAECGSAVSSWDHLLERLEFTHRHVMNGRQHIRRQHEIIAKLESEGLSTNEAKRLLDRFQTTQKLFEELYESVQKQIDARLKKDN
jgi:hypothetical protein